MRFRITFEEDDKLRQFVQRDQVFFLTADLHQLLKS